MDINNKKLKQLIREEIVRRLLEEPEADADPKGKKADVDFDPENAGIPIPAPLKKLLDPDLPPAKFAALDQKLDASDNPAQQAVAVVAFALNYADDDPARAKSLLQKAVALVPKMTKGA